MSHAELMLIKAARDALDSDSGPAVEALKVFLDVDTFKVLDDAGIEANALTISLTQKLQLLVAQTYLHARTTKNPEKP